MASAGGALASEDVIGPMLRDLHAELASYPGQLPFLAPLQDIPSYLARPQTRLTPAEAAALATAHARLTAELGSFPARPLHGDAGAGNLMATSSGWIWHDFEDTCSGPVAWDVAASTASQRLDARRVLAAYGDPVDPAQLEACEQLRRLHLTVWYNLYAERLPHLRPRAAELLTLWPPPVPDRRDQPVTRPVSEAMNATLAPLSDTKTILLTTYKQDGTPVPTPVSTCLRRRSGAFFALLRQGLEDQAPAAQPRRPGWHPCDSYSVHSPIGARYTEP